MHSFNLSSNSWFCLESCWIRSLNGSVFCSVKLEWSLSSSFWTTLDSFIIFFDEYLKKASSPSSKTERLIFSIISETSATIFWQLSQSNSESQAELRSKLIPDFEGVEQESEGFLDDWFDWQTLEKPVTEKFGIATINSVWNRTWSEIGEILSSALESSFSASSKDCNFVSYGFLENVETWKSALKLLVWACFLSSGLSTSWAGVSFARRGYFLKSIWFR